jgi:hypothetical protein
MILSVSIRKVHHPKALTDQARIGANQPGSGYGDDVEKRNQHCRPFPLRPPCS